MRYLVVVERTERGYEAWCPDLRGCVASGRTREDAEAQIGRVVDFHVCSLRRAGGEPPLPRALPGFVEVSGARTEAGAEAPSP